jgi:shikimate dehydrogenase
MNTITGKTKLLGVIGNPIEHSLSPTMHNAAIAHLDIDYIYLPFAIEPQNLATAIAGFTAIGVQGFSVTIPHKQTIIPLLSDVSAIAQTVGAVNTVWKTDNGWSGTNTDVEGFIAPLKALNHDWSCTSAVILGNGGAARAVIAGCDQLGCAEIHVVGRNPQKLAAFQQSWSTSPLTIRPQTHSWAELPNLLPKATLLINTTPIGMHPHGNESPLTPTEIAQLPAGAIAYDLIYTPNPTQFLQQAQQQKAIAIDGLEMLIHQGAAAFKIWLQQPAPIEIMRHSLEQHLQRSAR